MLKFSLKYYVKCIILSVVGYVCGGFILSFLLTEVESMFSLFVPVIISIIGITIRIILLNHQLKREGSFDFGLTNCFKMSIPALCLFILTAIILLCDIYISNMENLIYQSLFDNIKMCIWVLFPGALTVDGIIYNLSYWNNTVYYVLLIANVLIYILPVWLYMACTVKRCKGTRNNSIF